MRSINILSSSASSSDSAASSTILKSKLQASLESIKRFFGLGGWKRLPKAQKFEDDDNDGDGGFIESDSLIASHQSLPVNSSKGLELKQLQVSHSKSIQSRNRPNVPIKRIVKDLIDDEIPLINL